MSGTLDSGPATVDLRQRISVAGCRLLVQAGQEQGVPPALLLAAGGLDAGILEDPEADVESGQQLAMLLALHDALGERARGLGLEYGMRIQASLFGIWGYALLSSPTLRDAAELACRFLVLSGSPARVQIDFGREETVLQLDVRHLPERIQPLATELVAAACIALQKDVLGIRLPLPLRRLAFAHAPQAALERYREIFGMQPEFGQAANVGIVDSRLMDLKLPQGYSLTWKMCVRQCSELLQKRRTRHGIAGRVRERLMRQPSRTPSLGEMALALGTGEGKLRRQLAAEQTSYRQLVDEVKRRLAMEMLARPGIHVQEVADRLGYESAMGFSQSFKRWTGQTPSEYQRQHGSLR